MRFRRAPLAVLPLLCLAVACASTPVMGPPSGAAEPPGSDEEQVETAARVASERPSLAVRYNPVKCPCPPFEVQLESRWIRVEIDQMTDPETAASLLLSRAKADEGVDPPAVYLVAGDLSSSANRCGQGTLFLSLTVTSVQ